MEFDIAREIGAITREVFDREHAGRPARVVVASRTYDGDLDEVWDALTQPERIARWFLPISGELRLHGRYQLEGNAGGQITVCEPPGHFALTWEFGGEVTWVDVRLTPEPNGETRLVLEHTAHIDDERWQQFGPGAVGVGWDLTLLGLGRHLASGAAVDPKAALSWLGTDEGKQFVRGSSDGWRRASAASGTPEDAANAAAERTFAAYTGASGSS
jgi:uncharacterized protein YndB with AHSA1/START domain